MLFAGFTKRRFFIAQGERSEKKAEETRSAAKKYFFGTSRNVYIFLLYFKL